MRKFKKLTMTLAALLSMTAGAWAQNTDPNEIIPTPVTGQTNQWTFTMPASNVELQVEYEPEFTATFKAGNANTIQGDKATVTVTESGATEGTDVTANIGTDNKLTPVYEGQTITLTAAAGYKFKSVEAKKKAAKPDGAISGVFSVSASKKVYFSKGNLRYASGAWSFFDNQYDYYASYSADAWDKFGWSTSATTYGMNTSTSNSTYSGDFADWGNNSELQTALGTGWFTLSSAEWTYLLNTRTVNGGTGSGKSYTMGQSVNGKPGVVIYPDNYTGAVYSGSDWATFESAGCVFLPAAGRRNGESVSNADTFGYYWSATPDGTGNAYIVYFGSGNLYPADNRSRYYGYSVRLVYVAE